MSYSTWAMWSHLFFVFFIAYLTWTCIITVVLLIWGTIATECLSWACTAERTADWKTMKEKKKDKTKKTCMKEDFTKMYLLQCPQCTNIQQHERRVMTHYVLQHYNVHHSGTCYARGRCLCRVFQPFLCKLPLLYALHLPADHIPKCTWSS